MIIGLTSEELLAEYVPSPIQRHRPKHQQNKGHDASQASCNDGGLAELGLLRCLLLSRLRGDGAGHLGVDTGSSQNFRVVDLANLFHGFPVVVLLTKCKGENRDEDERAEQCSDVASEHRIVGSRAVDVENTTFLLGRHKPGSNGADET